MKHCPAPDCSYRVKHGAAAEFLDVIEVCSDCGAPLTDGPAPAASSTAAGPLPRGVLRALSFSVLGAVGAAAFDLVPLPFIELSALGGETQSASSLFNLVPTQLSVGALGVGPWLTAFMVVELVALLFPALRPLRLRPEGRQRLNTASLGLGLLIAAVHAWMLVSWMKGVIAWDGPLLNDEHTGGGLVGAAVIAGALGMVLLATAVDHRGLINGFSVVIGGGFAFGALLTVAELVVAAGQDGLAPVDLVIAAACMGGSVALGWFGTGGSDASPAPRPASGTLGAAWPASVLMLPTTLATLTDGEAPMWLYPGSWLYTGLYLSIAVLLALGITRLLYSPARVRRQLEAMGASDEAGAFSLGPVLLAAAGFTLALGVLQVLPQQGTWVDAGLFVILGAIGRDLWEALQRRRAHPDLVNAWPLHRLHLLGPVLELLQQEGIPASARGLHHRVLGQIFTPWVPVDIMVPAVDVERTQALLDERLPRA